MSTAWLKVIIKKQLISQHLILKVHKFSSYNTIRGLCCLSRLPKQGKTMYIRISVWLTILLEQFNQFILKILTGRNLNGWYLHITCELENGNQWSGMVRSEAISDVIYGQAMAPV